MGTYVYVGFSCGANGGTTNLGGAETQDGLKALAALYGDNDLQYAADVVKAWHYVENFGRDLGDNLHTEAVGSCAYQARQYFLNVEQQFFGKLHECRGWRNLKVEAWRMMYGVLMDDEECCDKVKIKAYLVDVLGFELQQADAILPFVERLYWG